MAEENKTFLDTIRSNWVVPFLAILTSVNTYRVQVQKDDLTLNSNKLDNLQKNVSIDIEKKEFKNNLKLTLYNEVKNAIKENNPSSSDATRVIINELLKDDSSYRENLINILINLSKNKEQLIQNQEKFTVFNEQEEAISILDSNSNQKIILPDKFTIDIFYLEDKSKVSEPLAKKIVNLLQNKYKDFNIRLRLLPKEINSKIGYRIDENQIRYNTSEKSYAADILQLILSEKIFSKEPPALNEINYATPSYISVFVKNN